MATWTKVSDSKVLVAGSLKVATLTDGEKTFDALPQVINIGGTFYKRANVKELSGTDMAYASTLVID